MSEVAPTYSFSNYTNVGVVMSLLLSYLIYLFDYYHNIILVIRISVLTLLLTGFINSLFKKLLIVIIMTMCSCDYVTMG